MDAQRGIILYDRDERVVGYVEVRNSDFLGRVKVIHNFEPRDLVLSMHTGGDFHLFELSMQTEAFVLDSEVNLANEVFATIVKRKGENIIPLASGIINADKPFEIPLQPVEVPVRAVVEVDTMLRAVWDMDEEQAEIFTGCLYSFA
ncbi:MAG: hypothetical protein FWE31_02940 [Firmicutes bacterium]|nr:hypothetical protein [Bacillota bacterium]